MAQNSRNIQNEKQEQRQSISQQQVTFVRLLELPIEGLEERVRAEVMENPALEMADADSSPTEGYDEKYGDDNTDDASKNSSEESADEEGMEDEPGEAYTNDVDEEELAALGDYRTVDDIPDYATADYPTGGETSTVEMTYRATNSFYDNLKAQLSELHFKGDEEEIAEYLIGSIDDDGLLRKSMQSIVEELAIYRGIYTDVYELEAVQQHFCQLEPAGVGAKDLQECLRWQLIQKQKTDVRATAMEILMDYYDDFTYKRWERIMQALNLNEQQLESAVAELTCLNPRPGSSLGEVVGKSLQGIVPDFLIRVDDEEHVTFSLNDGNVPDLCVNSTYVAMMADYSSQKETRESREAVMFLKQKIEAAQSFIDVVEMRRRTLVTTMQAIIDMQHDFFVEGDERKLKPMLMKDVAERAGVDVSTVSRVSNCKYAETPYGIFPLKWFFGDSYRQPNFCKPKKEKDEADDTADLLVEENEPTSVRQIKAIIQECVAGEDKRRPMTDEQIMAELKEKGYDVARRTVAKYRTQLGIPVARMRR